MRWLVVIALLAACEDGDRARRSKPSGPITEIVYAIDSDDDQVIQRAVHALRTRIDERGVDGKVSARGREIVVELAGDAEPVRELLTRSAQLELAIVDDGSDFMTSMLAQARNDPELTRLGMSVELEEWRHHESGRDFRDVFFRGPDRLVIEQYLAKLAIPPPPDRRFAFEQISPTEWRSYLVERTAAITGANLERASVTWDPQTNRPEVRVDLDDAGTTAFGDVTAANIGKKLAILLDGRVRSAPVIQDRIGGGELSISMGSGDPKQLQRDADDLAAALSSGALPAPIVEISVRQISP